jgi:large subunit ribosomal protein L21
LYAIIESGGKQFKVSEGDVIRVEKLEGADGDSYTFENVLVIADGDNVNFGKPYIKGASVSATVTSQGKAKKVVVYKFKSKKGFHKKNGHRQPFTSLRINSIKPA